MYNLKKLVLIAAVLALVVAFAAGTVGAQATKIGFVKDDRIKAEYKAWQRAQEQWELEAKAWDEEAGAKQQELQDMVDEYSKQQLILSDDKKKEREAAIRAKQEALDAFTKQVYGPNGTAERKNMQLIQPLLENVTKAIEAVAIEGDYDVVFTLQSGLGYIKESYDLTDKVLEYLEKTEE